MFPLIAELASLLKFQHSYFLAFSPFYSPFFYQKTATHIDFSMRTPFFVLVYMVIIGRCGICNPNSVFWFFRNGFLVFSEWRHPLLPLAIYSSAKKATGYHDLPGKAQISYKSPWKCWNINVCQLLQHNYCVLVLFCPGFWVMIDKRWNINGYGAVNAVKGNSRLK